MGLIMTTSGITEEWPTKRTDSFLTKLVTLLYMPLHTHIQTKVISATEQPFVQSPKSSAISLPTNEIRKADNGAGLVYC